jgi:hypothetical protein
MTIGQNFLQIVPIEKDDVMLRNRTLIALMALALVGFGGQASKAQQGGGGMGPGSMGPGGMMHGPMMHDGGMGRGGMMGGCMMGMMSQDDGSTFAEGRIAFLKAELAITDAQKDPWSAYAEALKHNFEGMKSMRQNMMSASQGKTPVERLDAHIAAMEGRIKSLNEVKPALTKLYDALSAEQRKKADEIMSGMGCMM